MQTVTPTALIVHPIRTLHGGDALAEELLAVRACVEALARVVANAAPNGRDYYPQGDDAFKRAVTQHGVIQAGLVSLSSEIYWLVECLVDGPDFASEFDHGAFAKAASLMLATPDVRPTIHTNGTSVSELRDQALGAYRAAGLAEDVFRAVVPNARDHNPDGIGAARAQHIVRVEFVRKVATYFLQMAQMKR